MLKEFFNIFRDGDEEPTKAVEHPHLEAMDDAKYDDSTYLDFLFERLRPRVEERLQEHPDSDPMLELATGVLVELFPDYWEVSSEPLQDQWTLGSGPPAEAPPTTKPPAPPADGGPPQPPGSPPEAPSPPTPPPADEVAEFADEIDAVEPTGEPETTEPDSAPDEPEEAVSDGDTEEIHDIDDLGVAEEESVGADPPAGFVSSLDDTAEFEPPPVTRASTSSQLWPMALSEPAVLHGARVLLAVLLDNDRLPEPQQLSVAEIAMAADVWAHLIARASNVDEQVQQLAQLVEEKFGTDQFSQARLLLKLFPTNRETRLNNDRQLFFEDMIMRMGVRRQKTDGASAGPELRERLAELELDDDASIRSVFSSLTDEVGLRLHVYTRRPSEVDRWRRLVEVTGRSEVVSDVLDTIPPRRWRGAASDEDRTVRTALREHLVRPMVRNYVIEHLKTCYFVLRTVGDTGLESYLDPFFDWSVSALDRNALEFLDGVHEQIATEQELMDSVFGRVYDDYYREPVREAVSNLGDDELSDAFSTAVERMGNSDLSQIAAGHFDLGGFVLDAYFDFEYPEPEFPFKIHRLT